MKRFIASILSLAFLLGLFVNSSFAEEIQSTEVAQEKASYDLDKCRELKGSINKNLDCYFENAKEKIKAGERHVTVQNERNIPNHRLELFRYTALDEIIPSLKFEKEPDRFIDNKYRNTFNLIKSISTGMGLIVGVIWGIWLPKGISYLKNKLNKQPNESVNSTNLPKNTKTDPNKTNKNNNWIKFVLSIIGSGIFAFLGRTLAECGILNFKYQKYNKLRIDKKNSLLAMECLSDDILENKWKNSDCIFIKTDLNKDSYESVPFFLKIGVNYSSEEKKKVPKDFEKLKQSLEEKLKNNK